MSAPVICKGCKTEYHIGNLATYGDPKNPICCGRCGHRLRDPIPVEIKPSITITGWVNKKTNMVAQAHSTHPRPDVMDVVDFETGVTIENLPTKGLDVSLNDKVEITIRKLV